MLRFIGEAADLACEQTSASGCALIAGEQDVVRAGFEEFRVQLAKCHERLDNCQRLLTEYEAQKASFCSWLEEIGSHFKSEISFGGSLEEKEQLYFTLEVCALFN